MPEQSLDGLVLSSKPLGEQDRLLVVLSDREGLLRLAAPGARRPKSSLAAAVPLALLQLQIGGNRGLRRLRQLQVGFAEVCNQIAPVVQQSRCWNRVALHHMLYRSLRDRFPAMGSPMVCNAIYSVSRSARTVLQHPASPWNVQRHPDRPLPLIRFADSAPVYFDRHTLSIRDGQLSMFTLDGRMRFDLQLGPADEARFHNEKLLEVVLAGDGQAYSLTFRFGGDVSGAAAEKDAELPQYLVIVPQDIGLDAPLHPPGRTMADTPLHSTDYA